VVRHRTPRNQPARSRSRVRDSGHDSPCR
jgi:hypothetical protein